MLQEDALREYPLDWLEMVYSRALLHDSRLRDHLRRPLGRLRYGRSCRDLSSAIPQELVALHAAIGARALRVALEAEAAKVSAWTTDAEELSVEHIEIQLTAALSRRYGDWTVVTDQWLLDKVAQARLDGLPNETGGVLIGAHDTQRRVLYLVDVLPSPPDSEEWPTLYIRGSRELTRRLGKVDEITDGQLGYAGEWHSHPRGRSPSPSGDDRKVFAWLQDHMRLEALPAAMLVVGEGDSALFVGSIP
jgi:Prokaryotic homologs of the JAB domain